MRARILLMMLACLLVKGPPALAQQEVTSDVARYSQHEVYGLTNQDFESAPLPMLDMGDGAVPRVGGVDYPSGPQVRPTTRLADSHRNLEFYAFQNCLDCHQGYDRDFHSTREVLACRQCHGGEPIPMGAHYYAPMNPIRKHAYVCAQCHEGAGASFAEYVVHEPPPGSVAAANSMPILFWAFWIMVGITAVTFVLFLPHTLLWVVRELAGKGKDKNSGGGA